MKPVAEAQNSAAKPATQGTPPNKDTNSLINSVGFIVALSEHPAVYNAPSCAAVLISPKHVLANDTCMGRREIYGPKPEQFMIGHIPGNHLWIKSASVYPVPMDPIEAQGRWALFTVSGDPTQHYRPVRIARNPPKPGEEIVVVNLFGAGPNPEEWKCHVGYMEVGKGAIIYTCPRGRNDQGRNTKGGFLFNTSNELVALQIPRSNVPPLDDTDYWPEDYNSAILMTELTAKSPVLASIARSGDGFAGLGPAGKIVGCFTDGVAGNKTMTITQMYDCSGFWVTPRALLTCSLGEMCPALPDTVEGRATLDATLAAADLSRGSLLMLRDRDIPRAPNETTITRCKETTGSEQSFQTCVANDMSKTFDAVRECFMRITAGERTACLTAQVKDKGLDNLIGCMGGGTPSLSKMLLCARSKNEIASAESIRNCVATAQSSAAGIDCLKDSLSGPQVGAARCMTEKVYDPLECLSIISPDAAKAGSVAKCLGTVRDRTETLQCLSEYFPGEGAKIAGCLSNLDPVGKAICIAGDTPEVRAAQHAYKCISMGRDASSAIENCTDGLLDDKSRRALGCVSRSNGDRSKIAECAVGAVLPPEAARLVGCVTSSQGPTDFALCAVAPAMNEEWRTAAECAASTGGEPISFVGCTAGRLTLRELTKCFKGKIGEDCFGPNNTIVVTLRNAYNDITQGPGENNEVVKALRAIADLTGGDNSVINNPGQIWGGDNSVFNNPGQIWGGDNSVFNNPGQIFGGKNSVFNDVGQFFGRGGWRW
ncbi:hypothetical protein [Microvirga ossetica]|nr:hypothetical protein [Microvirga ossetica]